MGAKAKARKAFKEKQAKQRQHMKVLGCETTTENGTEDDDDDFDGDTEVLFAQGARALPSRPVCLRHSFDPLSDNDAAEPSMSMRALHEAAALLNEAKKVKPTATYAQNAREGVRTPSLADLDKQHLINALPRKRKSLATFAKLCPSDSEVWGPNKVWVMPTRARRCTG